MTQSANRFIGALVLVVIVSTLLTVGVFFYVDYSLEAEAPQVKNEVGSNTEQKETYTAPTMGGEVSIKINNTQGDSNE